MTIYYFVRHGSTNDSGKRITGYIPGVELNNEGRQQARRIAEYFASITLTAIYSSPLERAIETAEQVGYKKSITIQPISFLKEINFGCYQGRGEDLRGDTLWETFLTKPAKTRFPEGESVAEAQLRVIEGLTELSRKHPENDEVLCVAHCEILRLAIAYALRMPVDEYMRITIDTGSISRIRYTETEQRVEFLNHKP